MFLQRPTDTEHYCALFSDSFSGQSKLAKIYTSIIRSDTIWFNYDWNRATDGNVDPNIQNSMGEIKNGRRECGGDDDEVGRITRTNKNRN